MKIGIDLDEVLSQSTPAFIEFHNYTYKTKLNIKNKNVYSWWEFIGGSQGGFEEKVSEFYASPYARDMKPLDGAKEVLEKLKKNNELFVITARTSDTRASTEEWLAKHFPNIFSKIYFTGEFLKHEPESTKKGVCNNLGVDIFIDDNVDYAVECIEPNRKVFLLNYPWNLNAKLPEGVTRVNSWKEIGEKIN